MTDATICGMASYGAVRMRGVAVAAAMGAPFADLKAGVPSADVVVLVKRCPEGVAAELRRSCRVLIWDPLDSWISDNAQDVGYWSRMRDKLGFDVIVSTSPSCSDAMWASGARVHMLPHHADPRIGHWVDPKGPVVYCGGMQYVMGAVKAIAAAAKAVGHEFLVHEGNEAWKGLKRAALCVHMRVAPHDYELNRLCKPQVKAENAMAARVPVVGMDPCFSTLYNGAPCAGPFWGTGTLAALFAEALAKGPRYKNRYDLHTHAEALWELIRSV